MTLVVREPTTGPKPPTDLEMAAIVAVVEEMWPHQTMEDDMANRAETAWKFANRWWQGSSVGSRLRPRRPGAFS